MSLYRLLRPALFALDPETAHRLAVLALKAGLSEAHARKDDPVLATRVFGLDFPNPVGLAAGFDKNGEAPDAILGLGFGFAEVGTVTPKPQAGNPRPRLFRLVADGALVNRMGFNNDGIERVAARLARRARRGVVGVNIGQNKGGDATADYVACAARLSPLADYLVVNVSSPNTPGLRALQGREPLARLLAAVREARDEAVPTGARPPLLVKIAPDLADDDLKDIAEVARALPVDGIIATNTTVARPPGLKDPQRGESGGLSGKPLFEPSTRALAKLYELTGGTLPLVGVGGVASGMESYAKIRAGASLVQLYTALVYEGPGLVGAIKRELAELLRRDGFSSVAAAVGADHRPPAGAPEGAKAGHR
ncbi:MAG: quinone-dependent dihydroorotate dehydrogenase [Rhodospirillales bacterium]|nr:quinone-dependent dihydroorotate dehydrogenase [Rhodospirillales bacterium]